MAVAWYIGHTLTPQQYPTELWNWDVTAAELARAHKSPEAIEAVRLALLAGEPVKVSTSRGIPATLYAVLEKGRAVDDMRRARLQTAKVMGSA